MMTPFEAMCAKIREEMNRITDETINGSCPDYPSYQRVCGIAYGLALAESIIKDTERAIFRQEFEDDGA